MFAVLVIVTWKFSSQVYVLADIYVFFFKPEFTTLGVYATNLLEFLMEHVRKGWMEHKLEAFRCLKRTQLLTCLPLILGSQENLFY